jgi:hypothetical protein
MSKAKNRSTRKITSRHLSLTPAQIAALEEMCTLSAYTTGFTFSPAMERVCKTIADKPGPAAKLAYLAHASEREPIELIA